MKDIERWLKNGLIDESTAKALAEDIKSEKEKRGAIAIQIVLYTIGVILLGLGIICFISANSWLLEFLQRNLVLRIFILLAFSVLSMLGGWSLAYNKKNFPRLGNALIFLSSLLIGATYIQMGQAYNWEDNVSSVLLLWLISILPAAFVFKSVPVNWIAVILFFVTFPYLYYEWKLDTTDVWVIFIPLSLAGILYTFGNIPVIKEKYNSFSLHYKITALIPAFFTLLTLIFWAENSYYMPVINYIAVPVIIIAANILFLCKGEKTDRLMQSECYFVSILMLFLLLILSLKTFPSLCVMLAAHVFLIFIIAELLYWGYKSEKVPLINTGNLFLLIYLLSVYTRYGWNYMNKTLFFLCGACVLLGSGIYLERQKQKIVKTEDKQ